MYYLPFFWYISVVSASTIPSGYRGGGSENMIWHLSKLSNVSEQTGNINDVISLVRRYCVCSAL